MPKENGTLAASQQAIHYAQSQLSRAIDTHRRKPITENLLAVADLGRWSIWVGSSLSALAGLDTKPWQAIYSMSIDYLKTHQALDLIEFPDESKKLDLIRDNLESLLRKVSELPQRRQRKAKSSVSRKEAA